MGLLLFAGRWTTNYEDRMSDAQREYDKLAEMTRTQLPKPTCPRIDDAIQDLAGAKKVVGRADRYDDVIAFSLDVGYELLGIEDKLEELRQSNDTLRDISQRWRDLAESLLSDLDKTTNDACELQSELEKEA